MASTTKRAPLAASLKSGLIRMFLMVESISSMAPIPFSARKAKLDLILKRACPRSAIVGIGEAHLVAFTGKDLGNGVAHQTRTDYGYMLRLHESLLKPQRVRKVTGRRLSPHEAPALHKRPIRTACRGPRAWPCGETPLFPVQRAVSKGVEKDPGRCETRNIWWQSA